MRVVGQDVLFSLSRLGLCVFFIAVLRLFTFSDRALDYKRSTPVSIACRCKDWQCVLLREIEFLLKNSDRYLVFFHLWSEVTWMQICASFKLWQKYESGAQSADSSKTYRKPTAFICRDEVCRICLFAANRSSSQKLFAKDRLMSLTFAVCGIYLTARA